MPNAKGQVEMDELSSDMSSYDARVSVNEDFHSFLNQLDFSKEEKQRRNVHKRYYCRICR